MKNKITNIIVAGLGGQGVLKGSDIIADAAFRAGLDVKKSEIHGMSQRGGSVTSDVRFGEAVFSPMVPDGEGDYLIVLKEDQVERNLPQLAEGGTLIDPNVISADSLENKKSLNVAMVGALSAYLDIPEQAWVEAIKANLPEKVHDVNMRAFQAGRDVAKKT